MKETGVCHFWPSGELGKLYESNLQNWLLRVEKNNPALFDYFRAREEAPRALVAWFGEFPGKLLTCVAECHRMTGDPRLLAVGERIAERLREVQDEEGYLGPYRRDQRMTGCVSEHPGEWPLWDIWGHYHCIYGLCLWYETARDSRALETAERAAGYVMRCFGEPGRRYNDAGRPDQNLGISHGYWKLYELTGRERYRREANRIVDEEWKDAAVGDWRGAALSGLEYYQMVLPRWESLHSILALGERARFTGDAEDLTAFSRIWNSILQTDRHNDGGFSSGEGACGNPYDPRAIETCCTILWMVFTVEYLRLTRDCRAADEFELSLWNAYSGSILEEGAAFAYNTPMDGRRVSSARELCWQSPSGVPDLNCCQTNGSRGFGQWGKWAFYPADEGIYCNYYGECRAELALPDGARLGLRQTTRYPLEGAVELELTLERPSEFALYLRIPAWSPETEVRLNGELQKTPVSGAYLEIRRLWSSGDKIGLRLDLSPHFWFGKQECEGKVSVYCGPVLLAADSVLSGTPWVNEAEFSMEALRGLHLSESGDGGWFGAHTRLTDGAPVRLVDFAGAGRRGQEYVSWLRVRKASPEPAVPEGDPVWCGRFRNV